MRGEARMNPALANNKNGVVGNRGRNTPIMPKVNAIQAKTNQNTLREKCKSISLLYGMALFLRYLHTLINRGKTQLQFKATAT